MRDVGDLGGLGGLGYLVSICEFISEFVSNRGTRDVSASKISKQIMCKF